MSTILIADDEARIRRLVSDFLKRDGHTILEAADGKAALELIENRRPTLDLAILDVMMPGMDGFEVLREIREQENGEKHLPVMLLTARAEDADQVRGLEGGADDYVTKPFNILELKARIRALLRRAGQTAQKRTELLTAGGIALDTERRIALRDGVPVDLTAKEYDILELLIKNPHRVYSRENLMDLVWGFTYAGDYRTVDVHIRRLREKLEHDPAEPKHIMTKWGVGYYLKD